MNFYDERIAKLNLAITFYGKGNNVFKLPNEIEEKVNQLYDCVVEISKNKGVPVLEMIHVIQCLAYDGKICENDILSFNI